MRRRTFVLSGLAPLALSGCGGGDAPVGAADTAGADVDTDAVGISETDAQALSSPGASHDPARGFRPLPPVGGTESEALCINRAGVVAGFTGAGETANFHPTVWRRDGAARLPQLGEGGSGQAGGINDAGAIVGNSALSAAARLATLWIDGQPVNLGAFGDATASQARAINNGGQIVGWSYLSNALLAPAHAVLWQRGEMIDLGTLGGSYSDALDINAAGVIVGTSTSALPDGTHATVWQRGAITRLGDLGGLHSYANAVNDRGVIVGSSDLPGADAGQSAVRWHRGRPVALDGLGGIYTSAEDVDNAGLVVGWSYLPGNQITHAVVWLGRRAIDMNRLLDAATRDAGWVLGSAGAINDRGSVAGSAYNTRTGDRRGFTMSLLSRP